MCFHTIVNTQSHANVRFLQTFVHHDSLLPLSGERGKWFLAGYLFVVVNLIQNVSWARLKYILRLAHFFFPLLCSYKNLLPLEGDKPAAHTPLKIENVFIVPQFKLIRHSFSKELCIGMLLLFNAFIFAHLLKNV